MANRNTLEEKIRLYVETSGDKEIGALAAQLTKLAAGSDQAAAEAQQLVAELGRLTGLQNNIRQFTALKASMTETAGALERAKQKLAEINAEVDRAAAPTERLRRQQEAAARQVTELSRAYNRQQADLTRNTNALKAAGVDTQRLGSAYADLQAQLGALGGRAGEVASGLGGIGEMGAAAARGLGVMGANAGAGTMALGGVAGALGGVAVAATAALAGLAALGTASFLSGALRSATTLEDALVQVQAVTGASAAEMEKMQAAAESAAASTRFTALEAAQGLGELARATGTASSAIEALPAALTLAQAAGLGVADAADIVTQTLTSFQLSMTQASRVADVFAAEANSTNDTVAKLGEAMKYAAPDAKALGMSLEDTVAIIGALASNGRKGEAAGTALRGALAALKDPASEFARTLREAGIESTNFADIAVALSKDAETAKRAMLALGTESQPALAFLLNDSTAKLQQLRRELGGAAGEAERTAARMGQSTTAAAQQVSKGFDQIRRDMVEPLLDPLRKELLVLTQELVEFSKTPEFAVIRDSLLEIFQTGIEGARRFASQVDWDDLLKGLVAFAETTSQTLTMLLPLMDGAATAVNTLVDAFQVGFHSIQYVVAEAASKISGYIAELISGFDQLSAPQRRILEFIGVLEEGEGSLADVAARFAENSRIFGEMADDSFAAAKEAATEFAAETAEAVARATTGTQAVAEASREAAAASEQVASAAKAAASALTQQGDAAQTAAAQGTAAAREMGVTAEQVRNAFADLGLKSQADLERAATAARRNFDLIRQASAEGKASAEDVRRAYGAYAEATRAAAADSDVSRRSRVENELAVQAAVLGVADAFKDQGAAARGAGSQVAQSASTAANAYREAGEQATSYGDSVEWISAKTDEAAGSARSAAAEVRSYGAAVGSFSAELVRALMSANQFVNSVDNNTFRRQFNAVQEEYGRQQDDLERRLAALDREAAKYDEIGKRVEELRAQYRYLGDDALRTLAEREKQVADLERREREQASRASEKADEQAAASLTRRATELTDAANDASDAIERASSSMRATQAPQAGRAPQEIVIRLVSEAAPGATPVRLTPRDLDAITRGVMDRLQQAYRNRGN